MSERNKATIEEKIGHKIRLFRQKKAVTLDQLAEGVRLTKGQLSRIENGKVSSPVSTLTRIAGALGITVGELFTEERTIDRALLVKKAERKKVVGRASKMGHTYHSLAPSLSFPKAFEAYVMKIESDSIDPSQNIFRHPGQEMLYMLSGKMVYRHGDKAYELDEGDSLNFDGNIEHGPVSISGSNVEFLCVIENASPA
jgi:DNA-binding XRE family transcriptional regulator